MSSFLYILLMGLIGVVCRYGINLKFSDSFSPYHTLFINLIGSLLMGILATFPSSDWNKAILVGFLGGLTTFSAYSFDVIRLVEKGLWIQSILYFSLTPLLGVVFCGLGYWVFKK